MNQVYEIEHPEIGRIKIVPKRGNKHFHIRLKPGEDVLLTAPVRASAKQVLDIIERKKNWIISKQKINKQIQGQRLLFSANPTITVRGKCIRIIPGPVDKPGFGKTNENQYTLLYPSSRNPDSGDVKDGIISLINFVLKTEAQKYLPSRLAGLSEQCNIRYNSVKLRNNRTRWGSCSTKGNINLNIQLMRLPDHLIDYVLIHELTHIIHPNHGPNFKALLSKLYPAARQCELELKNRSTQFI